MNLIETWPDEMTIDDKIKYLLLYYNVNKPINIEDNMKEMILSALNQNDINHVYVDEEEGLNIEYYGE